MSVPTTPTSSATDFASSSTEPTRPSTPPAVSLRSQLAPQPIPPAKSAKAHDSPGRVDIGAINVAAKQALPSLLQRWLPDGKIEGREFVARNPRRADRNRGSFKVNLRTGRWADFATGDRGGDPISLAAYLFGLRQIEAARKLAHMLGLPGGEARHD